MSEPPLIQNRSSNLMPMGRINAVFSMRLFVAATWTGVPVGRRLREKNPPLVIHSSGRCSYSDTTGPTAPAPGDLSKVWSQVREPLCGGALVIVYEDQQIGSGCLVEDTISRGGDTRFRLHDRSDQRIAKTAASAAPRRPHHCRRQGHRNPRPRAWPDRATSAGSRRDRRAGGR